MGLLQTTQQAYYQGNNFGNYQFTSLINIINQFMISYVGEDKIISKVKRSDITFHAKRAMQELSFDTFKSCKAQEITVPATLQMILPQDYVNYTKISWSDSSGIKHRLYPTTCKTSNPISINQDDDGNYEFTAAHPALINGDFETAFTSPWEKNTVGSNTVSGSNDSIGITSGALTFNQYARDGWGEYPTRIYTVWQAIDVSNIDYLDISAEGTTEASGANLDGGTLWFGLSSTVPDANTTYQDASSATSTNKTPPNLGYIEWLPGATASTQTLNDEDSINVTGLNTVYVVITSFGIFSATGQTTLVTNSIDDITVTNASTPQTLQTSSSGNSTTWSNYSSNTPSENNNDDYEDDTYWPIDGERYGLDPQHAQANGSFYIDCVAGKIHFSSNMNGKTLVLDYISDSLGTDEEMQVHKFAEEAMYKHIAYAVLSTRINTPEYIVQRFKKEKFAETRKAKLRLSNIKLEEITQIFRGKSKHIKH